MSALPVFSVVTTLSVPSSKRTISVAASIFSWIDFDLNATFSK